MASSSGLCRRRQTAPTTEGGCPLRGDVHFEIRRAVSWKPSDRQMSALADLLLTLTSHRQREQTTQREHPADRPEAEAEAEKSAAPGLTPPSPPTVCVE